MKPVFKNKPNQRYVIDGKEIWQSRSIAVNCIVIANFKDKNYILISKRGSGAPDFVGLWNVVCGYLDYDETLTEAAIREVYEETGLYLQNYELIIDNLERPWYINSQPTENRQNVTARFGCVLNIENDSLPTLTSENSEPNEVDELKWIKISDVNQYEFAFKHNEVIQEYLTYLVSNMF